MSSGASEGTLVTTPVPEDENQQKCFYADKNSCLAVVLYTLRTKKQLKHTGSTLVQGEETKLIIDTN